MPRTPLATSRRLTISVVATLLLLLGSGRAAAQTPPPVELAVGTGAAITVDPSRQTAPAEWLAAVAWPVGSSLSVVVEFSRLPPTRYAVSTRDTYRFVVPCESVDSPPGYVCEPGATTFVTRPGGGTRHISATGIGLGLRLTRRSWRLQPFFQVIASGARLVWEATLEELPPGTVQVGRGTHGDFDADELPRAVDGAALVFQAGGGLNLPVQDRLTLRVAAECRRLVGQSISRGDLRVTAQVAVALGVR